MDFPEADYSFMVGAAKHGKSTLDARFRFADNAFPGGTEGWNSQLRFAIGIADGEHYLLRLFKKTGTALDEDLKRLITQHHARSGRTCALSRRWHRAWRHQRTRNLLA
jgi:DNA polymerase alpha-associated DNA helicase A